MRLNFRHFIHRSKQPHQLSILCQIHFFVKRTVLDVDAKWQRTADLLYARVVCRKFQGFFGTHNVAAVIIRLQPDYKQTMTVGAYRERDLLEHHLSFNAPKATTEDTWGNLSETFIRRSCTAFRSGSEAMVAAERGHFKKESKCITDKYLICQNTAVLPV